MREFEARSGNASTTEWAPRRCTEGLEGVAAARLLCGTPVSQARWDRAGRPVTIRRKVCWEQLASTVVLAKGSGGVEDLPEWIANACGLARRVEPHP